MKKKFTNYSQYVTGELSEENKAFISTGGELYVPERFISYFLFGNTPVKIVKGKALCPFKLPALAKAVARLYSSKTTVVYSYGKRRGFYQPEEKYVQASLLKTIAGEIEGILLLEDFDKVCNDIRKSCSKTVDVSELKVINYNYEETEKAFYKAWEENLIAQAS